MFISILKAFIIGICASAPIGPIAILVIQKSLSKGHKAGFITGDLDDDKDKRAAQYAVGMQPNAIKIGDSYYSYDWIPVLGPSLSAGAAFAKAWEDEDNPLLSGVLHLGDHRLREAPSRSGVFRDGF